jgi:hypothetical protein
MGSSERMAIPGSVIVIRDQPTWFYGILPSAAMPRIKRIPHMTEKRKTNNLAIAAAPAAMSVFPNTAAASAITKKMPANRSIDFTPADDSKTPLALRACHCYQDKKRWSGASCGGSTADFAMKYDSAV